MDKKEEGIDISGICPFSKTECLGIFCRFWRSYKEVTSGQNNMLFEGCSILLAIAPLSMNYATEEIRAVIRNPDAIIERIPKNELLKIVNLSPDEYKKGISDLLYGKKENTSKTQNNIEGGDMDNLTNIVEKILDEYHVEFMSSNDELNSKIAVTNADCWGSDGYEVTNVSLNDNETIYFSATINYSGNQLDEKPPCGDAIEFSISGVLKLIEKEWQLEEYDVEKCKLNF